MAVDHYARTHTLFGRLQDAGHRSQYSLIEKYRSAVVCVSVCPSVCPSVRLFTFEVSFKRLFAPTSRSRMPNIFWDSESLGKSNWKKWSQIWFFFWFGSGLKLPRKKSLFIGELCSQEFFFILFSCHLSPVTSHLSPVTCHLSTVTYHLLFVTCLLTRVEGLDV